MSEFPLMDRFSTRLLVGVSLLILLATLSAGVPAYWLTRNQLNEQAWARVENGRQATRALLAAEQERLDGLAALFAERPTLQRLAAEADQGALGPYLRSFQNRSRLDLLLLCKDDERLGGAVGLLDCENLPPAGFVLINGHAALIATAPVFAPASGVPLGVTVTGRILDDIFLQELAEGSGLAQAVVLPNGSRLDSSRPLPELEAAWPQGGLPERRVLNGPEGRFYTVYAPLSETPGLPVQAILETALPVNQLIATEQRALMVLAGSTALVALIGALVGVLLVRTLLLPLRELTDVAGKISEGDIMAPIPIFSSPAEVRTLATALHQGQASMLHALEERSEVRDWFDALIQSMVEGVIAFDDMGRVTFLSEGATRLLGWDADSALGRPWRTILPPGEAGDGQLTLPPPGERRRMRVRDRRGKPLVIFVTRAEPVHQPDGRLQEVLVIGDVTGADALDGLRTDFLANISHEFRTPLSTLSASLEILVDEEQNLDPEEMRALLQPMHVSLLSLQTMVDNLLENSRLKAGVFTLRRQPTFLGPVADEALRIVRPLVQRRRQAVVRDEMPGLPAAMVDPPRITQVLVNLLTNASKYSPIGQPITLSVRREGDFIRVAVADRGPGVSSAQAEEVFRRFVRLDAPVGEQAGIGLGLHVVERTVSAHGGEVGVRPHEAGGAVFWFTLPVALVEERVDDNIGR